MPVWGRWLVLGGLFVSVIGLAWPAWAEEGGEPVAASADPAASEAAPQAPADPAAPQAPEEAGEEAALPETARASLSDEEWERIDSRTKWNLSVQPGYGLLYVKSEKKARHGFAGQLLLSYSVKHPLSLELRGLLGLYSGDSLKGAVKKEQGLYSQAGLSLGARYTLSGIKPWFEPYAFLGIGWLRTELDREVETIFVTHSMLLQAGAGMSFRITRLFWMGTEASVSPLFFGSAKLGTSFSFQWLANAEFHF